jgi:hypothetical protein
MSPSRMSRRQFLATSVGAGVGVVGLGALANAPGAAAAPVEPLVIAPRAPARTIRRYISRPDLHTPGVTIVTADGYPYSSTQPGYIFTAPRVSPGETYPAGLQPGLMILDLAGDLVWFQPMTAAGKDPFNFRVQTYKNQPTLTWFQGTVGAGYALSGEYVLANNKYSPIATVTASGSPSDLHEFILTPEGTGLLPSYVTSGDLIVSHAQEIDVATNDLVLDWSCYPAVSPSESFVSTTGDYFHINSIDLWPGSARNLLISGRNTCAVYLVDRETKKVIWRLNGKKSDFKLGKGAEFSYQHDARALTDGSGVSLFDDASTPSSEKWASGKVLTLDQKGKRASLRHQYLHADLPLNVPSQGNCQLLPNGGHMVGWGALPYFSEYRASGGAVTAELVLDGRFPAGVESYRSFMFDWVGDPPQSELRLVVQASGGSGHFTAWVSWNGATEVAAWRLEAGPSAHSMDVLKTVKKRWFETPIEFTRTGAKAFRCAALDSKGAVISRTSVVGAS